MSEFTGERVVPGQVNDDLWGEHVARYALATRFAAGRRVLDLGCGTGYGTADLARVASAAVGVDLAPDAIAYALSHFPSARFLECSASAVPFPPASFDLVTAFEVIEHLRDWRALLAEAHRVLEPNGLLIVSTPNKRYYAEARAKSGPNPFHEHEFEFREFKTALSEFFPHVEILFQDRVEAFAFYDGSFSLTKPLHRKVLRRRSRSRPRVGGSGNRELLHRYLFLRAPSGAFQLSLCPTRRQSLAGTRGTYPIAGAMNPAQVRDWLDVTTADRNAVQKQLESEQVRALNIITELNEENRRKTEWALGIEKSLTAEIERHAAEIAEVGRLLDRADADLIDRTEWARRLDAQLQEATAQLEMVRQSRWLKLGRQLGIGPQVKETPPKEALR